MYSHAKGKCNTPNWFGEFPRSFDVQTCGNFILRKVLATVSCTLPPSGKAEDCFLPMLKSSKVGPLSPYACNCCRNIAKYCSDVGKKAVTLRNISATIVVTSLQQLGNITAAIVVTLRNISSTIVVTSLLQLW